MDKEVIKEGDTVVIKSESSMKIFEIKRNKKIFIDKVKFSLDATVGQCFGSLFALQGCEVYKIERRQKSTLFPGTSKGLDNRNLLANMGNQKITEGDIEKMKKDGVTSDGIIEKLVENSSTFETKTEYSQQKYVKKKKLKHERIFIILRPTAHLLAQIYFQHNPSRIGYLREDSLAEMLHLGNIHSGLTAAVVDTCNGLLVASIMEKMGGVGRVIQLYPGDCPSREAVKDLKFSPQEMAMLYCYPLKQLTNIHDPVTIPEIYYEKITQTVRKTSIEENVKEKNDVKINVKPEGETESENMNSLIVSNTVDNDNEPTAATTETSEIIQEMRNSSPREKPEEGLSSLKCAIGDKSSKMSVVEQEEKNKRRIEKMEKRANELRRREEARTIILAANIDCLLVTSRYDPTPIVSTLIKYLAPSRPLVVHCQHMQPLMEIFDHLKEEKLVVNMRMCEKWYRHYQVLPERTHPMINMSSSGGFLLSATKIMPS